MDKVLYYKQVSVGSVSGEHNETSCDPRCFGVGII